MEAADGDPNPIDAFLQVERARAGLRPAPEAPRETLIRRVTLDLTGLPPTLEEVDAFVSDSGPDAYGRLVDRLLASPAFGERWAVPWLDAARYADSNGYEKDGVRPVWKYRDWVVSALNADMPFDQFTLEQIAGDLLPGATPAQRIATGFHRNTMFNEEAGVDPEEARWERLVDRVSTTATIWLGSTLGCAQCHDHKHDPFSQRDFYGLLAFFEGAQEQTLALPTPAQASRLAVLEAELAEWKRTLDTWTPALGKAQVEWEARLRALDQTFSPLAHLLAGSRKSGQLRLDGDGAVLVARPPDGDQEHDQEVTGDTALDRITGVRLVALPGAGMPGGGPGLGRDGAFFLAGLEIEAAPLAAPGAGWRPVPLAQALADDRPREEPERYAAENLLPDRPRPPSLDADTPRGWGVSPVYDGPARRPRQLVLIPRVPFGFAGGTRLRVRLRYGSESQGEVIGRFRLTVTGTGDPAAIVALDGGLRAALDRQADRRSQPERDQLAQAYRRVAPALHGARARLAALQAEREALGVASTLVLAPATTPAATLLRRGGSFLRPGERVTAALPAWLRPPGAGPADRLALGRWLASASNPLAARAQVNRLWALYFGRGLTETVEDLGHQGARPSHPALLDWLATELGRQGWRQKPLHRLIVTSATYRQSVDNARARRRDPDNRLLARAPRLRLEAEMVRDVALSAGGILDRRLGGPPVFPPQPPGVFTPPNSTEGPWRTSAAPDRHRRALYTFWRRSAPHPAAALFDAPSRQTCTVRRPRSRTPLQALATLNDPALWEAAQALGRRMRDQPPAGATLAQRIAYGFRLATGRSPRPVEIGPLLALARRQQARAVDPASAADDLALALVGNVLLNLDETLSRS